MAAYFALMNVVCVIHAGEVSQTTWVSPDHPSDHLSQDGQWNISTPDGSGYATSNSWHHILDTSKATDEFIASQTGMNMVVSLSDEYGFDQNRKSSLTITVDGGGARSDIIFAFGDKLASQYVAAAMPLRARDVQLSFWYHPQCPFFDHQAAFAAGDVTTIADGSDYRLNTVSCPGDSECDEGWTWPQFPYWITITNDPPNNRTSVYVDDLWLCYYAPSFQANQGPKFYIGGSGAYGSETFYITNVSITKTGCDDYPEWGDSYDTSYIGGISFFDDCDDGATNFQFAFDNIREYVSSQDSEGTSSALSYGQWSQSDNDQFGDNNDASARINTYTNGAFSAELITFLEPAAVDGREFDTGTIKYGIYLESSAFSSDAEDAKLEVCLTMQANNIEETTTADWEQDAFSFTMANGAFKVESEMTATCSGSDDSTSTIDVAARRNGNELCYTFPRCDGRIEYDPFVYYEGEDASDRAMRQGCNYFGISLVSFIVFVLYELL